MSKTYKIVTAAALAVTLAIGVLGGYLVRSLKKEPEPQEGIDLQACDFYPLRASGDNSDQVFAYDEWVEAMGYTDVKLYCYSESDKAQVGEYDAYVNSDGYFELPLDEWYSDPRILTNELRFTTDNGNKYVVRTVTASYGITTSIEITRPDGTVYFTPGNRVYAPLEDGGMVYMGVVVDNDSPFMMDRFTFDVWHTVAFLDKTDGCPFEGYGLPHMEGEDDWHDDAGTYPRYLHF